MRGDWKTLSHDERLKAADELLDYGMEVLRSDRPTLEDRESASRMIEQVRSLLSLLRGEAFISPEAEEKITELGVALMKESAEVQKLKSKIAAVQENALQGTEMLQGGRLDQTILHLRAILQTVESEGGSSADVTQGVFCPHCNKQVEIRATIQKGETLVGDCGHVFKA